MGKTDRTIEVAGRKVPCYLTLGALRRFKRITGHDLSATTEDIDENITMLYCCVMSACNAEGVELDMDEERFADSVAPSALARFAEIMAADTADTQKKTEMPK